MKTTLYNIQNDYITLMNDIEENEGVLTKQQSKDLDINKSQLETKSVAYLEVIKQREAFISIIDDEINRLTALKKRNSNLVATLKERLLHAVQLFGQFEIGTLTFTTRKSESVIVEDVNSLPDEYKNRKVTESADKAHIKLALKTGKKIKGCSIQENLNLSIK